MRPETIFGLFSSALLLFSGFAGASRSSAQSSSPEILLIVSARPALHDVPHIGLNLGRRTSWGAEQLASNVIENPGFEGVVDGSLGTVVEKHGLRLTVGGNFGQRSEGFWSGGAADIRTGPAAGKVYSIAHSSSGTGRIDLLLASEPAATPGDVVALRRVHDHEPPVHWWLGKNQSGCAPGPPRPNSPGIQSLVLCSAGPSGAEASSFLDGTTARSGKLLPIVGRWKFSYWVKTLEGHPSLSVSFGRSRAPLFFDRRASLGKAWQHVAFEFAGSDQGPDGPLQLRFFVNGPGRVAIDDVSLSPRSQGQSPFRSAVLFAIRALQPGYLRDWQGQLGDTLSNRLAVPFARRATRYRSASADDAQYEYSIPEFLELCRSVNAAPWLVLPTSASDKDFLALGSYLRMANARFRFREVIIEFGNENWNSLFSAAGITDTQRHIQAAARAFLLVRKGAGPEVPLRTAINAPFAKPSELSALAAAGAADIVAVAPYFAFSLPAQASTAEADALLFAPSRSTFQEFAAVAASHEENLAFYEINLHTTNGAASESERNSFVLRAAAGAALGKRLIDGWAAGIRVQCVYSLSGYDAYTSDRSSFVQLWGVTRDLTSDRPRLRSTGLAVALLNAAVQKEMHSIAVQDATRSGKITAVAFWGQKGWTAAVVSEADRPLRCFIAFPVQPEATPPERMLTLADDPSGFLGHAMATSLLPTAPPPFTAAAKSFTVPPRSLAVLLPNVPNALERTGQLE